MKKFIFPSLVLIVLASVVWAAPYCEPSTFMCRFIQKNNAADARTYLGISGGGVDVNTNFYTATNRFLATNTLIVASIAAKVPTNRTITINGTANEITSSAGAQSLDANRTWTLSLPTGISATKLANGSVDSTEFQYLDGVSSGIQAQIDTKVAGSGVSGRLAKWSGLSSINDSGFTIANAAGTERLTGPYITVNNLSNTVDASFTGTVSFNGAVTNTTLTASRVMVTSASKTETSSSVTATELGYVSGVTSALQTQIDAVRVNGAGIGQNGSGPNESASIADPVFLTTIAAGYISAVGDGFHVIAGGNSINNETYTYRFLVDGVVVWTSTPTDGHPDWRFEADVIRSGGNTEAYITGWFLTTSASSEQFSVSSSSMTWSDGANVALAIEDGGSGGAATCGMWRVIKYKAP